MLKNRMKLIFMLFSCLYFAPEPEGVCLTKKYPGRQVVVIIYGKSCSGKTTIRKWLQALSSFGFIYISVDLFLKELPIAFGRGKSERVIPKELFSFPQYDKYLAVALNEQKRLVIKPGPDWSKYLGMPQALFKILLDAGNNIVVEEVIVMQEQLNQYLRYVTDKTDLYLFRLEISPETLRKRAMNRDGAQFEDYGCLDEVVDLAFDSEKMSPREIAESIINYVDQNKPAAIHAIRKKYCTARL